MTQDKPTTAPAHKTGELERLGPGGRDLMVLGLDAPGFGNLSTDRKTFAYYMYRAAIAGDRIMYLQNHRDAAEIKDLLEAIYTHADGMRAELRDTVHDYLKYFWVHHGNYHHSSHTKFVPNTLTYEGLQEAADAAMKAGASIDTKPGETITAKLERLQRTIFDPDYEPLQSNHNSSGDVVASSAVNFWDAGITQADLDALPSDVQSKINVRFARSKGKIVPEVYKIGGAFDQELRTISHFLELALPYSETDQQRRSIELLLEFYRSGDEEDFRRHCVEWLKSDTTIDYVNGFIEQYIDPRGVIGNFEANVSFAADASLVHRISESALYFERRMPWPEQYKRDHVNPPVAKVVNVLMETGDGGPVSPAAYNLPNYNDIRRDHGSKNVMLLNVENASSTALRQKMIDEFYLPEYRDNILKYGRSIIRPLKVYLHEIIGHGSGQPDEALTADPRSLLGRLYSSLEECRADLVALYHMSDPKLVEIGAFTEGEQQMIVETTYISYLQSWLTRIDRVVGLKVREAHNKGHHLILMYLLENGGNQGKDFGVDMIEQGSNYFIKVRDTAKVYEGLKELLIRLQVLKSTGDVEGAAALFDRFATNVEKEWHANITKRLKKLGIPRHSAFVFPHLRPKLNDGRITEVELHCDEDLTAQQLRFSRLHNVTAITEHD
jgi:dipeptidyl-peptidase-3